MFERWAKPFWVLVALTALGVAGPTQAEETSAEDEAAIMAQEDAAEAALPLNKKPPGALTGRVQLSNEATEEDTIVGYFAVKNHAYILRLAHPSLFEKLQPYNGKTVCLEGAVRMQGKYFIVRGIQLPAPGVPRTDRDKRSGM